jgi:hypothetical protein
MLQTPLAQLMPQPPQLLGSFWPLAQVKPFGRRHVSDGAGHDMHTPMPQP